jgi:hypothetical protein
MEFCRQSNRLEDDHFSAVHHKSFNTEALLVWRNRYVQRNFELGIHKVKYMYREENRFDFQTSTRWNVIGRSVIAPPCYCPTVFFHSLGLIALSFPQRNVRRELPKYHSYCLIFQVTYFGLHTDVCSHYPYLQTASSKRHQWIFCAVVTRTYLMWI